jgi:hypothetical protein
MTEQTATDATRDPSKDEIEALFVNNPNLQTIESYLSRFNPIRVMKMAHMEICHSAILSWLLDPSGSHGLGDHFLRAFLGEALRGHWGRIPSALEVAQADLRDAEVRNEWHNIDIFVQSPRNRWAFIIENKFYSAQHSQQLQKYKEHVRNLFIAQYGEEDADKMNVRGIFLTLGEEAPEDSEYTSIRYEQICVFLRRFLDAESYLIAPEVTTFLHHYLEILEVETGMSEEQRKMEQLARQLYRTHKRVLDFVVEHGAGSGFALAAQNLFGESPDRLQTPFQVGGQALLFSSVNNSTLGFVPQAWFDALDGRGKVWPGCDRWWAGLPVICWANIWTARDGIAGQIKLQAEVGPLSPAELRTKLIDAIKAVAEQKGLKRVQFQTGAANEDRKYSRFFRQNILKVDDVHNSNKIQSALASLIGDFQNEFEAVAGILSEFRLARLN